MGGTDTRDNLKKLETHFAFGKNWASYVESVGDDEVNNAVDGLRKLVRDKSLKAKRFLDIGCGSGIHCLAALLLGAAEVVAIDLDPDSVNTTKTLLARRAPESHYRVECASVFDLDPETMGTFDVVYSWGVLHHTGDMNAALCKAADLVAYEGEFIFALYRRTWLCPFWKVEKRVYSQSSPRIQRVVQRVYIRWFRLLGGLFSNVDDYIGEYETNRGMKFCNDVHDWLGGYPYESILPVDVQSLLCGIGFKRRAEFLCISKRGKTHGLLGSGCDEYSYERE